MIEKLIVCLCVYFLLGLISAWLAKKKGYSPFLWFFAASAVGLAILMILPGIDSDSKRKQKNAMAIVLALLSIAPLYFAVIWAVSTMKREMITRNVLECEKHLKILGGYIQSDLPSNFGVLYAKNIVKERRLFTCPASSNSESKKFLCNYCCLFDKRLTGSADTTIFGYCLHHTKAGLVNTLFVDGHVKKMAQKEFEKIFSYQALRLNRLGLVCEYNKGIVASDALAAKKQEVRYWIRQLQSQKHKDRTAAANALGKLGSNASSSLSALIFAFEQTPGQKALVKAIAQIGPTEAAIPALIEVFKANDQDASYAIAALAKLGNKAVPVLLEKLVDENEHIRFCAAQTLGAIGVEARNALPALIVSFQQESGIVRKAALNALDQIAPQSMPVLSAKLQNGRQDERLAAASAIIDMGMQAQATLPVLIEALNDQNGYVRERVIMALGNLGQAAVSELTEALASKRLNVRIGALKALALMGSDANTAIPQLIKALCDESWQVSAAAAKTLGKIGEQAAIPLAGVLECGDDHAKFWAAKALSKAGKNAKAAIPALVACLKDKNWKIRYNAANALGKTGIGKNTPILLALLKDESMEVRIGALTALGELGANATSAIPALAKILKQTKNNMDILDQNPLSKKKKQLKICIVRALGEIACQPKISVPLLIVATGDKEPVVKNEAIVALGKMGRDAKGAIPVLIGFLQDEFYRQRAANALEKIGYEGARALAEALDEESTAKTAAQSLVKMGNKAVPALIETLHGEKKLARYQAAQVLGEIGENARSAIPALKQALTDQNSYVRKAAQKALEKIR